jgi:hypothetical protein
MLTITKRSIDKQNKTGCFLSGYDKILEKERKKEDCIKLS